MQIFKQVFFDKSPDLLTISDMDGYFSEINDAWVSTLGWTKAEMTMRPWIELIHPEDVKKSMEAHYSVVRDGAIMYNFENRYLHKNGEYRWLQWSAISSAEDRLVFGTARDVTHWKEKELRVQEADLQLARSLNMTKLAALGEIAANIAHEINNPLSIIRGRASQLKDLSDKEIIKTGLQQIEKMSVRIANIVKTLRNFSRDSSQDKHFPRPLKDIINETMELCLEKMKKQGVQIFVDPIPDIQINTRGAELSQVLINLLDNSTDAQERVEKKWIKIEFEKKQKSIHIQVSDNGPGIDKDILPKIFEPFVTSKSVEKGTGLGLSIAHNIIHNHNGKIYVDSNKSETCFVLELPIV
jgi:PAS domain S-box-containing protein